MSLNKPSSTNNRKKGLQLFFLLILLCVYALGTLEISSLHTFFHDATDQEVLHSEINEGNSCHQSLYHNARDKSCEHPVHIAALKKCSVCQLSIQSFHLFDKKSSLEFDFNAEIDNEVIQAQIMCEVFSPLSPRAPPVA